MLAGVVAHSGPPRRAWLGADQAARPVGRLVARDVGRRPRPCADSKRNMKRTKNTYRQKRARKMKRTRKRKREREEH